MADEKRTPAPAGASDQQARPASVQDEPATEAACPPNETVPGGRYIVNGQTVDAEGRPLSEDA